ncbi:MAG: hypothetical protein ACPIOQ_41530 [Promethearchaeia archaeon]
MMAAHLRNPITPLARSRTKALKRAATTGSDRHGSVYWLVDDTVWAANDEWGAGVWRCYPPGTPQDHLIAFLNPKGPRERLLLSRLQRGPSRLVHAEP